jgi:MFS family permease
MDHTLTPAVPGSVPPSPDVRTGRPLTRSRMATGVTVLIASFMLNAMDRQVFYPLLPEISGHHGFTLSQAGLLATGFTAGMALAALPTGHLVDELSRKGILMLSILLYSAGTMATPLAAGFGDMMAYRLVSGVGEGMQATALFAALGAYFFRNRAFAAGLIGASFGVGVFLGPLVGTRIAVAFDDWRTPFFVFGVAGVVVVLLIAMVVPQSLTETTTGGMAGLTAASFDHVPAGLLHRNTVALAAASAAGGLLF